MKIIKEIVTSRFNNPKYPRIVYSSRAIIKVKNEYLMVYCKSYDDYTFPGGTIEDKEDAIDTLKREAFEEVGARIDNIRELGLVIEKDSGNKIDIKYSYFYLCDLISLEEPHLCSYEIKFGYEPTFVSLEDAYRHDLEKNKFYIENSQVNTAIQREIAVMEYIMENNL